MIVPLGIWVGKELNRRMSQEAFRRTVEVLVLLAGINLLLKRNLIEILLGR